MKVGIDLGGSHIGIGLINEDNIIISKNETFIKSSNIENLEEYIENFIVETLSNWIYKENYEITKVGIGIPGMVIDNVLKYSVNLGLSDFDLVSKLKNHFPNINFCIKNDAKCAALAEKNVGALKSFDDCIFLCLGTGIGGAAFYNGKMVEPKRCAGFEYGHIIIQKDGDVCRCGSKGCFEQYASMRKFKNLMKYNLNLDDEIEGQELKRIILENKENPIVKNVIDEFINNLCIGISNIVNILEPQAICIGGGFSEYKDLLLEDLRKEFYSKKYLFYKENMPEILIAELENDAGIIGSTFI